MADYQLLPYGIPSFKQVREENLYYVDKTQYIPRLESARHFLFLIRPRRFGKSIFQSMLRAYYDLNERDNFDRLFGGLWIADHPTPIRNSFEVLYLDFSQIGGNTSELYQNFNTYMSVVLDSFVDRYKHRYPEGYAEGMKKYDRFEGKLNYINEMSNRHGHHAYLIVDEYDNFTNTVLNEEGEQVYHALTHASGFYRDVFKKFKGNFDRILMMGVSPVTLDDLTSGYNIATNISMKAEFNLMLGFSEDDVRQMIRYYTAAGRITRAEDDIIEEMKPWYDNYCFSESVVHTDPKLFNCDMVVYYLNILMQTGETPKQMLDRNTRIDYKKMYKLIQFDQLDGDREGVLHEIAEKGYIIADVNESFPAEALTDAENFISLLVFYGMLTIGDTYGAHLRLIIPNNNVRLQYYDYLLKQYQRIQPLRVSKLQRAYDAAALEGDWEPMIREITGAYAATTSVRSLIEGERNLQGFMNAYLALNPYYLVAPELELNHGYCDFFLMADLNRYPMVRHSYIIELKYLKVTDTDEKAAAQWQQATEQIRQYAEAPMVKKLTAKTQLHLIVVQIRGYETVRYERLENC